MNRVESYNSEIAKLKATPPDFTELEKMWNLVVLDRFTKIITSRYEAAGLTKEQLDKLITIEIQEFRGSLSEADFRSHLNSLHQDTIAATVRQLEFERDNPDKKGEPAPEEQPNPLAAVGAFVGAVVGWLGSRIVNNVVGAGAEPGVGAQVLYGVLGISVADIEKNGILGGENSYLRKVVPTWSDNGGVFGGENSFFRKPFG